MPTLSYLPLVDEAPEHPGVTETPGGQTGNPLEAGPQLERLRDLQVLLPALRRDG